jgi:hypothetical protein
LGISYYLRKPITQEDLLATILKILPPAPPNTAAREDCETHQVFSQLDDFLSSKST